MDKHSSGMTKTGMFHAHPQEQERVGMDTKRTLPPTTPGDQLPPIRQTVKSRAAGVARRVSDKLLPWCQDHLLSMAVLVVVPVALGAFYWNRGTPDAALPAYLNADKNPYSEKHRDKLPKIEEAPLATVVPVEPIVAPETPQLLSFADATGEGEFDYPLPIAVPAPEQASDVNQRPALPLWEPQIRPASQSVNRVAECVWFTGGIEPDHAGQEAFQNTTRIHELTTHNRD
jgi:hypothetical protein